MAGAVCGADFGRAVGSRVKKLSKKRRGLFRIYNNEGTEPDGGVPELMRVPSRGGHRAEEAGGLNEGWKG